VKKGVGDTFSIYVRTQGQDEALKFVRELKNLLEE